MKRTIGHACAVMGMVLAMSACSSEAPVRAVGDSRPTQAGAATEISAEAAGSGAKADAKNKKEAAASPPPSAAPGPTAQPTDSAASKGPLAGLKLNQHGNLPAKIGEAGVLGAPTGDRFAEMEAREIQADFTCTADSAQPSINGQFVAIRFSVKAHSELPQSGWPYFDMSVHDFRAWDSEGEQVVDPVGNSAGCVDEAELLPTPVDPGGNASGLIILDVPEGDGSASFRMGGFEGAYGWEWAW
jgi:hypothetical protein